jgi:two-component system response regulator FixJ
VTSPRILVVEDDPRVARTISQMLERAGYSHRHVDNAASIVDAMGQEEFDLLIADIHLPDDQELGFLDRLEQATGTKVPVVLVTGRPTVETAVRALRYGVVDYLQKPFEQETLIASVGKALKWRQAMQVVEQAQRDAEAWLRSLQTTSRLLQFGAPLPADRKDDGEQAESPLIQKLSARERDIVKQLSAGQRVAEIATSLEISPNTVRNHLKSIFRKLGVSSQVELLARLSGLTDSAEEF